MDGLCAFFLEYTCIIYYIVTFILIGFVHFFSCRFTVKSGFLYKLVKTAIHVACWNLKLVKNDSVDFVVIIGTNRIYVM